MSVFSHFISQLISPLIEWTCFAFWQSFFLLGGSAVLSRRFRKTPWKSHFILTLGILLSVLVPTISLGISRLWGGLLPVGSIFAMEKTHGGPPLLIAPSILIGGVFFTVFFLYGILAARRLMFQARPFPDRESQEALLEGAKTMKNVSLPILFTSREVKSPTVWSWGLHPAVLLPESISKDLSPLERDGIFLHELAHIVRRDHWSAFWTRICGVFLFWNPLYWFVLRESDLSADQACDLLVLSQNTVPVEVYTETLLRLAAEEKYGLSHYIPTLQFLSRKEQLMKRINTILDFMENGEGFSVVRSLSWSTAALGLALFLTLTLGFCQENQSGSKVPDQNANAAVEKEKTSAVASAEEAVARFSRGDFGDSNYTETMKETKISEITEKLWNDFLKQLGPFMKFETIKTESVLQFQRVHIRCEFEHGTAVQMIVVDQSDKIAGLFVMSIDREENDLSRDIRFYRVDKPLKDFPEESDLSTPESAYAAFERTMCSQEKENYSENLKNLCVERLRKSKEEFQPLPKDWSEVLLDAKILGVCNFKDREAIVVAILEGKEVRKPFNVRWFENEDGKWFNAGNDRVDSVMEARVMFQKRIENREKQKTLQGRSLASLLNLKEGDFYRVDKRISEFPDKMDLSTPENAYASGKHLIVSGAKDKIEQLDKTQYHKLRIPERERKELERPMDEKFAELYKTQFVVLEVVNLGKGEAFVFGLREFDGLYDGNYFKQKDDGLWYNLGNDQDMDLDRLALRLRNHMKSKE